MVHSEKTTGGHDGAGLKFTTVYKLGVLLFASFSGKCCSGRSVLNVRRVRCNVTFFL